MGSIQTHWVANATMGVPTSKGTEGRERRGEANL